MNITVSNCYITIDDAEKALWFYRDVLGLTVKSDVGYENMRWVTVVAPSQPDLNLVLGPPNPDSSPADREAIADLMAKGLYGWLLFATDNCDATFEHIRAAGAEVVQEPIDQAYGMRDCAFRDPAGNMIRFAQTK